MSSGLITNSFKQTKRVGRQAKSETGKGKASDKGAGRTYTQGQIENKDLPILKQFDLTLEYGPCIGISRMERWLRAEKHGLNPPTEVKDLIEQHMEDELYTKCLWSDYSI